MKNKDINEYIYECLKEAEEEINNASKRYSKEDVTKSMDDIIYDSQK